MRVICYLSNYHFSWQYFPNFAFSLKVLQKLSFYKIFEGELFEVFLLSFLFQIFSKHCFQFEDFTKIVRLLFVAVGKTYDLSISVSHSVTNIALKESRK